MVLEGVLRKLESGSCLRSSVRSVETGAWEASNLDLNILGVVNGWNSARTGRSCKRRSLLGIRGTLILKYFCTVFYLLIVRR